MANLLDRWMDWIDSRPTESSGKWFWRLTLAFWWMIMAWGFIIGLGAGYMTAH